MGNKFDSVRIIKAVILRPGCNFDYIAPLKTKEFCNIFERVGSIDLVSSFSSPVVAVYNSYIYNKGLNKLISGKILSHSDIADMCHGIKISDIIGYFTKEGDNVLESRINPTAGFYLSDIDAYQIGLHLRNSNW